MQTLLPHLLSERVVDHGDEKEISFLTKSTQKAKYVICKIARHLEAGYKAKFYSLLTVMTDYGDDVATLANEIRIAVDKLSGTFFVVM